MEEEIIQGFASIGGGNRSGSKGFDGVRSDRIALQFSSRWGNGKQQVEPDQDKTMV